MDIKKISEALGIGPEAALEVKDTIDEYNDRQQRMQLKAELSYARQLLDQAGEYLGETPMKEEIDEFLEQGLEADGFNNKRVAELEMRCTEHRKKRAELDKEIKNLQKKNHDLAKSMSNAKDSCKPGFEIMGWPWPTEDLPISLDGMVKELVKRLQVMITYAHDYQHDDDCRYKESGEPDETCSLCSDGDMHAIIFKVP